MPDVIKTRPCGSVNRIHAWPHWRWILALKIVLHKSTTVILMFRPGKFARMLTLGTMRLDKRLLKAPARWPDPHLP